MFYDNHELLYKKFDTFSDMSVGGDSAGALTDGMMTLPEFVNLIEKACLLGSSDAGIDDELTQKEVRQAFAAAQTEVAFGAEERKVTSEHNLSHLQLMSYPEFVEARARLLVASPSPPPRVAVP